MGRSSNTLALGIAAVVLGAALVIATVIVAGAVERVKTYDASQLDSTGSADRIVDSDQVKWVADFSRTVGAGELELGYESMADDLATVLDLLNDRGVTADEIVVAPVTVSQTYSECYNAGPDCVREVVALTLERRVTVNSDDVTRITGIAQDLRPFAAAGVDVQTTSLQYFYSGLADARPELLAAATRDAQRRAVAMAEATGAEVGTLQAVESGVFQVTQVNSTEVSSAGVYDTSTIEKRITAVVRARFGLR